jgi:hypothetical protein
MDKNWMSWEFRGYWLKADAVMCPIYVVYRYRNGTIIQYYGQHIFKACYGLPQWSTLLGVCILKAKTSVLTDG